MRRAGRLGDGYISHMCSLERYQQNVETIARYAREVGRAEASFETCCFIFTLVDRDFDSAHARAAARLARIYRTEFGEAARRYCLLGRAEDCLERMQHFVTAGVRRFILAPLGDPTELLEIAERAILPALPGLAPRDGFGTR